MGLVSESVRDHQYTDSTLRGNLDQVYMSGFSLVVFEVEADTLLDLVQVCPLNKVMH